MLFGKSLGLRKNCLRVIEIGASCSCIDQGGRGEEPLKRGVIVMITGLVSALLYDYHISFAVVCV